jgi:hypothetical protein
MLHNTRNVIRLPQLLHEAITALYAKNPTAGPGGNIQDFLGSQSYEFQRAYALQILRNFGILK